MRGAGLWLRSKGMERLLESRTVYHGKILDLKVDTVQVVERNNRQTTREVVVHRPAVGLIALGPGGVVLVKQFRYPLGRSVLEIPAGLIEPGESPADAARRELREETGFDAGTLRLIRPVYTSPGFCDEVIYLFLAKDLRRAPLAPDVDEVIELETLTFGQVEELLRSPEPLDGKTLAGLSWLCTFREEL